jgi:4-carboxymuconolactone decarboxylase
MTCTTQSMDKKIFQKRGIVFALQAVEFECFCKGLSERSHIEGQAGEQVIASLADLAPISVFSLSRLDLAISTPARGMNLLQRGLITVAPLTALGTTTPQLKAHGLPNVEAARDQLTEAVIHVAVNAGFPAPTTPGRSPKKCFHGERTSM